MQTSTHGSLGLTCVDCHMPTSTGDNGSFTNHNASGSPLENPDAIATCMTCHESQGIETSEGMVAMVRKVQDETDVANAAAKERLAELLEAIKDANADASANQENLEEAKQLYTAAKFYIDWGIQGNDAGTCKAAHNAESARDMLARANVRMHSAFELLAQ